MTAQIEYQYAVHKVFRDGSPKGVYDVLDGTLATCAAVTKAIQDNAMSFPEISRVSLARRQVLPWSEARPTVEDWAAERRRKRMRAL